MNPVAQTSANATFQGGASAPMDIGALKGKGKKGKGKGKSPHWNFMKGKGKKGKGKGKGKDFAKGKKGKGKSKERKVQDFRAQVPQAPHVGHVDQPDTFQATVRTTGVRQPNFPIRMKLIGALLRSPLRIGPSGLLAHFTRTAGMLPGTMVHFGVPGIHGICPGILGIGRQTFTFGLLKPSLLLRQSRRLCQGPVRPLQRPRP